MTHPFLAPSSSSLSLEVASPGRNPQGGAGGNSMWRPKPEAEDAKVCGSCTDGLAVDEE